MLQPAQSMMQNGLKSCLEKAGFGRRLQEMPEGLDTCLYKDFEENGVEISGGEAQKIALARALYKDAPFIVLDEPTAALDPVAEYEVYSKFNEIVGDKTAIYISHRLSPAGSAIQSPYLITARSCSGAATIRFLRMETVSITSCGMLRPNITLQKHKNTKKAPEHGV